MRKIIFTTGVLIFLCPSLFGQQLSTYSLYRDNWSVINPAALSSNHLLLQYPLSLGANYRKQWWDLEDAPTTQSIHLEFVPDRQNYFLGGHLINDQTGLMGYTGIYGKFAYRLFLGGRTRQSFSIGLQAGLVQYRAKVSQIQFRDQGDAVASADQSKLFPDFGLGLFYHYQDVFYGGISVPQTFGLSVPFKREDGGKFTIKRNQHIFIVLGGYISLPGQETSFFEPSLWVRSVQHAPISIDVNLRYQHKNIVWMGTGWGSARVLHLETGLILDGKKEWATRQLKIGVGFDLSFAEYSRYSGNSIELNAIYSWGN